jgi:hypothetical protein
MVTASFDCMCSLSKQHCGSTGNWKTLPTGDGRLLFPAHNGIYSAEVRLMYTSFESAFSEPVYDIRSTIVLQRSPSMSSHLK